MNEIKIIQPSVKEPFQSAIDKFQALLAKTVVIKELHPNQIEIWFSILVKRLLKRLSVKSTDELKQKVAHFIDYFNAAMATPFKWTYKGRVLKA